MDYEYLFTYHILVVQRKNFSIFSSKISCFLFNFAFLRVIYLNLHTFIFLNVIFCNNKAICSINNLFIEFFSILIFHYAYLFSYHILLVQWKNFRICGSKIQWLFFNLAFFWVTYINLQTFIFLNVILCNNTATCSIDYLFTAFFSFLIFDYEYFFRYYILHVQRKNFTIFSSKNINLHTIIFSHVIFRNNKAICSINYLSIELNSIFIFHYEYLFSYYNKAICSTNHLFLSFFIFLFFDYEYLFSYHILLVQRKNFSIFGSKIQGLFINLAIFWVTYINLQTFIFLNVILCNNKARCSIDYLFTAFFSFLIFDYEYLFRYYILHVQRKNFTIFGSKNQRLFLVLFTSICIRLYFHM